MMSSSGISHKQIKTKTGQRQKPFPSKRIIATNIILYVITGIIQPILTDTLRIHGLIGRSWLLLPALANTTGMVMCGLLTNSAERIEFQQLVVASLSAWRKRITSKNDTHKNSGSNGGSSNNGSLIVRMMLLTTFVDLVSGMCLTLGLLTTGGAIFVILYNSCPIWTTLLSWMFLRNFSISWISLAGIMLVTFGVIANVFGSQRLKREEEDKNGEITLLSESSIFTGSIIIIVGSLLHSLMFVLSDLTLRPSHTTHKDTDSMVLTPTTNQTHIEQSDGKRKNEIHYHAVVPSGLMWSFCLGIIEAPLMLLWLIIGVLLYGFRDEDYQSQNNDIHSTYDSTPGDDDNTPTNIVSLVLGFILLLVIDGIHAATFFSILQHVGAVGSALLKGVQVVVVVVLTSIFFCGPKDESQCLTRGKAYSVVLVSLGVFCYGIGKSSSINHGSIDEGNHLQIQKTDQHKEIKTD